MPVNITIGQYYPVKSFIHRLDPRVKLLATVTFFCVLFTITSVFGYVVTAVSLGLVIYASNVPPKYMFKGLKMILYIIIFTSLINVFFVRGGEELFRWKFIVITLEGLITAIQMSVRLVMLIIGSSILTLTTSPLQLTDAIEYILRPFSKIGLPSHEIAMIMTIALRFIPTLLEEMDKIMKAQIARGADFDTGGIIKKAKGLIPLLVPLFISSFRRADELGTAMEARCYRGGKGRTKLKVMKLYSHDYKALIVLLCYVVISILGNIFL